MGQNNINPIPCNQWVRHSGILSPVLFNVCIDGLSRELEECKPGCLVGNQLNNHLMYADDLIIMSPYTGLQQLLRVCMKYGM